jgi:hypothetical protein
LRSREPVCHELRGEKISCPARRRSIRATLPATDEGPATMLVTEPVTCYFFSSPDRI